MAAESDDLEAMLKPFYQRASEAEERLARLEAASALSGNKDSGDKELFKSVDELQSKPEDAKHEHVVEKQEALQVLMQLRAENEKLQYRIIHLVRAFKDAHSIGFEVRHDGRT